MTHRICTFVVDKNFNLREFEEWALSHKLLLNTTMVEDNFSEEDWETVGHGIANIIKGFFKAPGKKKKHDEDGADKKKAIARAG